MFVFIASPILLLLAAQTLTRSLPTQNVILIIGSLIAAEFLLQILWVYPDAHWSALLFWPTMILWARIGTRWFLRRSRRDWNYGVCLIILASAAVALLNFAVALSRVTWSVAAQQSGVRFAEAAFCLFLLSPWFISKLPQQPQERA
jgi:uncharacterized membrane protein YfcA